MGRKEQQKMYLNDLGEDNDRCYYCRHWVRKGAKNYCLNPCSDYCSDWTEETFGCEDFEARELGYKEKRYAKKVKTDAKKK